MTAASDSVLTDLFLWLSNIILLKFSKNSEILNEHT